MSCTGFQEPPSSFSWAIPDEFVFFPVCWAGTLVAELEGLLTELFDTSYEVCQDLYTEYSCLVRVLRFGFEQGVVGAN